MNKVFLTFFLGVLGSLLILGVGAKWVWDAANYQEATLASQPSSGMDVAIQEAIASINGEVLKYKHDGYIMLALGVICLFAATFVSKLGMMSGLVMALAALTLAVLVPKALYFSFFLALAAIASYLIKPVQNSKVM